MIKFMFFNGTLEADQDDQFEGAETRRKLLQWPSKETLSASAKAVIAVKT